MRNTKDDSGRLYPLGATICPGGNELQLLSASASVMQLVLFDHADDRAAAMSVSSVSVIVNALRLKSARL